MLDPQEEAAKSLCVADVTTIGTMVSLQGLLQSCGLGLDSSACATARHDMLGYSKQIRHVAMGLFSKAGAYMSPATKALMEAPSIHEGTWSGGEMKERSVGAASEFLRHHLFGL